MEPFEFEVEKTFGISAMVTTKTSIVFVGSVKSGVVSVGDVLSIKTKAGKEIESKVISIERTEGSNEKMESASAGDQVGILFRGLSHNDDFEGAELSSKA